MNFIPMGSLARNWCTLLQLVGHLCNRRFRYCREMEIIKPNWELLARDGLWVQP